MKPLLEVIATTVADARAAEDGGADRLEIVGSMVDGGMSPEPEAVETICAAVDVPVRCMVRLRAGFGTDGGEATRLYGLVTAYRSAGAEGMVLGFLNGLGEVDLEVIDWLTSQGDWSWTFHRAIDSALDTDRAWRALDRVDQCPGLARLDTVLTAGSARGVEQGLDELVGRAATDLRAAGLIMAGGGLAAEHVPWLLRAGIDKFHVGTPVRLGRSYSSPVESSLVHAWRTLLDATAQHISALRT